MEKQVMENHGYDPKEYPLIYSVKPIEGSKIMKVFTDNETDNTISFNGTCTNAFAMRAERGTKQFAASLSRIRRKDTEEYLLLFFFL